MRWLHTISRTRATTSGGPNFAYDLCVRKIPLAQRETLELSSWKVAFNGAEPIRPDTLERFTRAFAPYGFRREAFAPCYGLAEATLIVSGSVAPARPVVRTYQKDALEQHRVVEVVEAASDAPSTGHALVGSGQALGDQTLVIAHPETLTRCAPDQVGEIWVSGPSIARGYWNQPEASAATFAAYLADTQAGPFLRTGDLGFVHEGDLFVTGRLKDLMIIRGRNHYPQDLEHTVERCHAALRPGCTAAFTIEAAGEERLVVVQEVDHRQAVDWPSVVGRMRQAISEAHDLPLSAVALLKAGAIAKTSSGKIQRRLCRSQFLSGRLPHVVHEWRLPDSAQIDAQAESAPPAPTPQQLQALGLEAWLSTELAQRVQLSPAEIDAQQPLTRYGLDSLLAVDFAHRIEASLGIRLPLARLLEGPSLAQLAAHILAQMTAAPAPATPVPEAVPAGPVESPLSHGQRAMWFLYQLAPQSAAYNLSFAARVRSALDIPALHQAVQALGDRHAALRTTYTTTQDDLPVQHVQARADIAFEVTDAVTWSGEAVHDHLVRAAEHPFDLEHGPLLRVHVLVCAEHEHVLLLSAHHIALDFWSLATLMDDLRTLYSASQRGIEPSLPPSRSYTEYVQWQADLLAGPEGERLWAYWHRQLAGVPPGLELPLDHPRPPVQTYRGASHIFTLSEELSQHLKTVASEADATPYMTLLAAFQVLLCRYSGQTDVVVGTLAACRDHARFEDLVGYVANPLAMRANLSGNPTFAEVLAQVRRTTLEALAHQDYPFPLLVERLELPRDPRRSPLFQVAFVLQHSHRLEDPGLARFVLGESGARLTLDGLDLESVGLHQPVALFDLLLSMVETGEGFLAAVQYNSDLFEAATMTRLARHFHQLLSHLVAHPEQGIAHIPLLTEAEREAIQPTSQVKAPMGVLPTLTQQFESQVASTPEAVAVVCAEAQLTYRELNRRANQLGHYLQHLGVGPEVCVGLCLERSLDLVVGILGVLKAGGAYVPMDPQYPRARRAFMMDDAGVSVLLTQSHLQADVAAAGVQVVCLDQAWETIARAGRENPRPRARPESLAYVIYTSGSTGRPKGVLVTHQNVARLFAATQPWAQFNARDVWTLFHSTAFDFSVWELWGALLYGGRLLIVSFEVSRSPDALYDLLCAECVTVLNQTPSAFANLMPVASAPDAAKLSALRMVIFGGEALDFAGWQTWFQHYGDRQPQLINM